MHTSVSHRDRSSASCQPAAVDPRLPAKGSSSATYTVDPRLLCPPATTDAREDFRLLTEGSSATCRRDPRLARPPATTDTREEERAEEARKEGTRSRSLLKRSVPRAELTRVFLPWRWGRSLVIADILRVEPRNSCA